MDPYQKTRAKIHMVVDCEIAYSKLLQMEVLLDLCSDSSKLLLYK